MCVGAATWGDLVFKRALQIINSTLGKAMGGATGGYTAANAFVVDMLRQRGRPYLFSNSLAPAVVRALCTPPWHAS